MEIFSLHRTLFLFYFSILRCILYSFIFISFIHLCIAFPFLTVNSSSMWLYSKYLTQGWITEMVNVSRQMSHICYSLFIMLGLLRMLSVLNVRLFFHFDSSFWFDFLFRASNLIQGHWFETQTTATPISERGKNPWMDDERKLSRFRNMPKKKQFDASTKQDACN